MRRFSKSFPFKNILPKMYRFNWLTKVKYSSLHCRLRATVKLLSQELNRENKNSLMTILIQYNDLFNLTKDKEEVYMNQLVRNIYKGNTIEKLIILMQFMTQTEINTISTFLQSSARNSTSLVLAYYMLKHEDCFNTLITFLNLKFLASTANIILRACIRTEKFVKFAFNNQVHLKCLCLALNEDFEIAASAIKTFQVLFNTLPGISSDSAAKEYATFSAQFITVLSRSSNAMKASLLSFLVQYLLNPLCSSILLKLISDRLFLMQILRLMSHKSHKIYTQAYSIFKIIMFKQGAPQEFKKILEPNRTLLLKCLKKVDFSEDEDLLLEHQKLISRI